MSSVPPSMRRAGLALAAAACALAHAAAPGSPPLALHPRNPHYFVWRGAPTILVGSAEHYGAVLNLDFDYVKYLDTLHADGLNHTRLFSGVYVEDSSAFKIQANTLAPARGRLIAPWARSEQPGYAHGGNKFDLARWDEAYFARLRDFMAHASRRGIVVEYVFFCPFYRNEQWALSPVNAANTVTPGAPSRAADALATDSAGRLHEWQAQLVRKVVAELRSCDNLYYEICNEPYAKNVSRAFEDRVADAIAEAGRAAGVAHLISQNVANGNKGPVKIEAPHPAVAIFNFHYAYPPEHTLGLNYSLGRAIGENETGFRGTGDEPYLVEAWEFLLAGGALYSNLDYSFAVGHEAGTLAVTEPTPGGGSKALRRQLRFLKDFLHGFDFVRTAPGTAFVANVAPADAKVSALAEPGRQYAIYVRTAAAVSLTLALPAGTYTVAWHGPASGRTLRSETLRHAGGDVRLASPPPEAGLALRIVRADR